MLPASHETTKMKHKLLPLLVELFGNYPGKTQKGLFFFKPVLSLLHNKQWEVTSAF